MSVHVSQTTDGGVHARTDSFPYPTKLHCMSTGVVHHLARRQLMLYSRSQITAGNGVNATLPNTLELDISRAMQGATAATNGMIKDFILAEGFGKYCLSFASFTLKHGDFQQLERCHWICLSWRWFALEEFSKGIR